MSWLVGEDFNIILSEKEKIGGLHVFPQEYEDFVFYINSCELYDTSFNDSSFTWWNERSDKGCIFKRLDRFISNQDFQELVGNLDLQHLARTGSDHAPMILSCGGISQNCIKLFRFLKFWTTRDDFKKVVKENWNVDYPSDIFIKWKLRQKKTTLVLSK